MSSNNFATYVISLNKNPPVLDDLRRQGLTAVLINGVDGRKCSKSTLLKHIDPLYMEFGPKSAQGCAISHLLTWKRFLKSDNCFALIFEDDVVLQPNFLADLAQALSEVPQDFDILALGAFGSEGTPNFFSVVMGMLGMTQTPVSIANGIKIPEVALGTHAYVLSRTGAQRMLKALDGKIHNHIDYCIQSLAKKRKINRYVVTPRIAYQTSTDSSVSSNVASQHPVLLNAFLSNFYIDRGVRANYISTLSIFRVGEVNLNISSIVFLLMGIVLAFYHLDIKFLSLAFLLLSLPDLILPTTVIVVWWHYLLFVFPSALVLLLNR
jgi:GR25 family glycosyltransferase involved in LPS biosynthesis